MLVDDIGLEGLLNIGAATAVAATYVQPGTNPVVVGVN
jgi:ABC-type uncharacterized transport system permease subunit